MKKGFRLEFILLVLIIALAAFLRFYKLSEYMTFLGDEGRDVLMVKRILTTLDIPLIGPPMSVGNIYLGPLYYYMMTIPMAVFWLNPVAAAGMVALIGTLTVGLVYFLTREWFGKTAAFVAGFLYAVSTVNIIYSRSSWNPNPVPFFTLLSFIGIYLSHKYKNYKWLLLTGVSFAFALQMHYITLLLLPILFLLWLYELTLLHLKRRNLESFFVFSIGALLLFGLLMSPLIIFDIKHQWVNFHAFQNLVLGKDAAVSVSLAEKLKDIPNIYVNKLVGRYMTGEAVSLSLIIAALSLISFVGLILKQIKIKKLFYPGLILTVWFLIGVLGVSLIRLELTDHYLNFLNPVPYLLIAGLLSLIKNGKLQILTATLIVLTLGFINFQKSPLIQAPSNQLKRTQEVANFVIKEAGGKPFNFALIAERNYDSAYQFYLDVYNHKPKQVPFEITDQLFVVCEDKVCEPINHPKYEIAAFGWAKIESVKDFEGVKVFKLVANKTGEPQ